MANRRNDVLERAMNKNVLAKQEDTKNNNPAALACYKEASDLFMQALKNGTYNEKLKSNIREQLKTCITRAEELKNIMKPDEKKEDPPSPEENDPDFEKFLQRISDSIVKNPKVSFEDVVGLMGAKQALREAVILPVMFPQLFEGKRKPWAGILLYGPPGTGKSYLAQAIAKECQQTFIAISAADLLSKWVGESEKGVKYLFKAARKFKPCIVFIDEIDSLCSERKDNESEASRRVKTEFLVQMQGVGTNNTGVLVLAATNIPWDLDAAIRRRFEKRIYIPLPGVEERAGMFKTHLGVNAFHSIQDHQWMKLAELSENYSGSDIAGVCREALLRPIRRISSATHFKQVKNPRGDDPPTVWIDCSPSDKDAVPMRLDQIEPRLVCESPVNFSDMEMALRTQKSSVGLKDLKMFEKFTATFGQEGS